MRTFVRHEIPRDLDPRLVKILRDITGYMEQTDKGFAAIERGAAPSGGGGGGSVTPLNDHHKLLNLTNYDDHTQYLLLAGRKDGQEAYGTDKSITPASAQWSVAGSFTAENSKVAGSSWAGINLDNGAAIGDIIVLNLTTLPFAPSLDTTTSNHSTITDTKGNTWTKRGERTYSDVSSNGCCVSIWTCQVTVALIAGVDTLTATYTGSIGAMAISSHRFLNSSSGTLRVTSTTGLGETSVVGDPSPLSLTGLPENTSYLYVRITGRGQAGSTTIGTFSVTDPTHTGFTFTPGASTSGGTGNVGSGGQYRIAQNISSTSDCQYSGGSVGYFASIYIALSKPPGAVGDLLLGSQAEAVTASKLLLHNSLGRFYGEFLYFRDAAGDTDLSYIRGSDGAFVGPVYPTLFTVTDSAFRISGSSDASKLLAFEVDGFTTATTRTITVPNVSATMILTQGTSAGQVIGTLPHTGGTASSLVVEGPMMIGDALGGVNFSPQQVLLTSSAPTSLGTGTNTFHRMAISLQSIATVNSTANIRGLQIDVAGTIQATSGTIGTMTGMFFTSTAIIPNGVTVNQTWGAQTQSTGSTTGGGILTNVGGFQAIAAGDLTATTGTRLVGVESNISPRNQSFTDAYAFRATRQSNNGGTTTSFYLLTHDNNVFTTATTWYGLKILAVSGPTTQWGIYNEAPLNAHVGKTYFGSTSPNPAHFVEITGGSTTIAPLRFNPGVQLTAPVVGAVEYTTDDLYFTIQTGTARKGILLNDGTALTAGRVPFATTNGRLTDDADFTFATDTLTITKIAATTITGDMTLSNINLVLGTGAGTKIGTATNQKLSFWNAAPIVQPTTGITAATFVANTSGIADDSATWDGYTMGQVVAALRLMGALA